MSKKSKFDSSFTAFVRPHLSKMYQFAYRLTQHREDAQDLVQDVLLKVYGRADKFSDIDSVATWLNRVLYNQFIDDRRRYSRRWLRIVEHPDYSANPDIAQSEQPSTTESVEGEYTVVAVQAALDKLSDDHRLIVVLHDVEGYTLTEIAEITGLPHGTIKSRRFRARERLQELLEEGPAGADFTSEDTRSEENDALRPIPEKLRPIS